MAKPESLGQFELLVLTAVLPLLEDACGGYLQSKVRELARPQSRLTGDYLCDA